MHSIGNVWLWSIFFTLVLSLLTFDIFFIGGKKHIVSFKEALSWTFFWIFLALSFNVFIYIYLSHVASHEFAYTKALEFFTGYIIEESLSVDNMFVFLMIFNFFAVPPEYQRRVLVYGLIGAIVLRFIMILMGAWAISKAHWILYIFGFFLVATGMRMLFFVQDQYALENNLLLNWLRKHMRVTRQYHEEHFFIKNSGLWYATPLFLVLVFIEFSDLIFALDSIPAIFAITTDPFIVFTSNMFAVMGLRALYFVLAHVAMRFHMLKYGIALMLVFIGTKMLVAPWLKIPILITLSIVLSILVTTVILSLLIPKKNIGNKL